MSVNIEMPKLSDTMTEGTLVKWHKQVGDSVEIGDILAEIETDKATMEMEAFDDGILTEILIQAGEKAPIGAILAVLNGDSGKLNRGGGSNRHRNPGNGEGPATTCHHGRRHPRHHPQANRWFPENVSWLHPWPARLQPISAWIFPRSLGPVLLGASPKAMSKRPATLQPNSAPAASTEAAAAAALAASIKAKAVIPAPIASSTPPAPQAILPVTKDR